MTYKKFLKELRKTPREWVIEFKYGGELLRLGANSAAKCPLLAVPGCFRFKCPTCSDRGLSSKMRDKIIRAADKFGEHDRRIRADLLRACGLKDATHVQ